MQPYALGRAERGKLWLFIHPRFYPRLCKAVQRRLQELRAGGGVSVPSGEWCNTPGHHKNLVLTPKFLKGSDVPYQVVVQQPGTLIYVREGVLHQVLNTGVNLAEAVNVGSYSWNNMAHTFVACGCPYARVRSIPPNPMAYQTGRGHTARVYECPRDGCLHSAATRAQAQQHARTHSRRGSDRPQIYCRVCSAAYLRPDPISATGTPW